MMQYDKDEFATISREFFDELDKQFPANHPFIVKWGPADKFREYIDQYLYYQENLSEQGFKIGKLENEIENLKDDINVLEDGIRKASSDLEDLNYSDMKELQEEIKDIIKELDNL